MHYSNYKVNISFILILIPLLINMLIPGRKWGRITFCGRARDMRNSPILVSGSEAGYEDQSDFSVRKWGRVTFVPRSEAGYEEQSNFSVGKWGRVGFSRHSGRLLNSNEKIETLLLFFNRGISRNTHTVSYIHIYSLFCICLGQT